MTTETLTCPYCNASLGIQPGWSAGKRIVCPRCGDTFPLRFSDTITDQPHPPPSAEPAITADVPAAEHSPSSSWSNRSIAGVVLGVMLFMASGGLVFMLMTQQQRRAYDTSRPPRRPGKQPGMPGADNVPLVASIAPDKLAALGYLPSDANLLLAARIPELLASPIGKQMLHDPIKLGEASFRLENLPRWLGFRLGDIDHFVLAARVENSVLPPFYLVLRTAQPYDEDQLRQRIKGTHIANPSKKTIYSFRLPEQEIQVNAWFADERTVVLALFADQLGPLPSKPIEDLRQLPEELRKLLKQRREPVAPIWIAGHSRDWNKTSVAIFLNRMKKEELEKLLSLRSFGVFLVPAQIAETEEESWVFKGVFACTDESAARKLENYFRTLQSPDTDLKTALDGPWLGLQFQTGPDFLARLLRR